MHEARIVHAKPSNARKLKMVMSATTKISYEYADAAKLNLVMNTLTLRK